MAAGRVHDKKIDVEIDDKEGVAKYTQIDEYTDTDIWPQDRKIDVEIDDKEGVR
jgi:hypothetical protein